MRGAKVFYFIGLLFKYLGEVMITQISGSNIYGVIKDPRHKAQSVQFKGRSTIPYKNDSNNEKEHRHKNALWTSVAIVAGMVFLSVGYFMLSGLNAVKKTV
jgi:hypothetical protein